MATRRWRWTGPAAMAGGGLWLALGERAAWRADGAPAAMVPFTVPIVLLLLGLAGLHARQGGRAGWAAWTVAFAAANGLALLLAGQVGAPWGLPAERGGAVTVQLFGLATLVLALGSLVYGLSGLRAAGPARLAAAVLAISAPAPLLAFVADRGAVAGAIWLLFGAGWVAMGAVLATEGRPRFGARFRSSPSGAPRPEGKPAHAWQAWASPPAASRRPFASDRRRRRSVTAPVGTPHAMPHRAMMDGDERRPTASIRRQAQGDVR